MEFVMIMQMDKKLEGIISFLHVILIHILMKSLLKHMKTKFAKEELQQINVV